jgi:hypothetical protein
MGGMQKLGFSAYPDGYPIIGEAIEGAVGSLVKLPWCLSHGRRCR